MTLNLHGGYNGALIQINSEDIVDCEWLPMNGTISERTRVNTTWGFCTVRETPEEIRRLQQAAALAELRERTGRKDTES